MTLIVEDGSRVANANSYINTTDFTTYATARNYTLISGAETLLIQAMDYLESLSYKGVKFTRDQSLIWPRLGVYVDGYLINSDTIPFQLKNALCEVAIAIDQGNSPLADIARKTLREKVDVIEVQYSESSVTSVVNKKIMNSLWKLLAHGNNLGNALTVSKG